MKKLFILFFLILTSYLNAITNDSLLLNKSLEILKLLNLSEWEKTYSYFDSTMKVVFPTEKIEQTWLSMAKQLGEMKGIVDTNFTNFQNNRIVIITIKFDLLYADLRFVYNRNSELSGFFITPNYNFATYQTPEYVDKTKFFETKYKFGKQGLELEAVLTLPIRAKGDENKLFPVVILVHGSGPNDMDESIGLNKPFKDLAWGLASNGIAVFRYNKRTQQHPEKVLNTINNFTIWDETVEDVTLAIDKLKNTPDIDPDQIYILGHSLGGYAIPKIYQTDNTIKGFIIMAGSVRPLEDLIWEQYNYIFSLDDSISQDEKNQLDSLKNQIDLVKSSKLTKDMSPNQLPLGIPPSYWLDLKDYKPLDIIKKANNTKFLVLQGERDYQVTMKDFDLWKSTLQDNENARFKTYSKLNHLFIEGEGKSHPDEYLKAGQIPNYVIMDIVEFIKN